MRVQPRLVLEERAKQQRNLPVMISFGARWKRAGAAQKAAPVLDKLRFAVTRLVQRRSGNRRHECHLGRITG
jgi:hypothetical protein